MREGMERSERFVKIQRLLKRRGGVSLSELMDDLQVKTGHGLRDLAYLRDRMGCPTSMTATPAAIASTPPPPRRTAGLGFRPGDPRPASACRLSSTASIPAVFSRSTSNPAAASAAAFLESRADSAADITRRLRIIAATARITPRSTSRPSPGVLERRRLLRYTARSRGETEERKSLPAPLSTIATTGIWMPGATGERPRAAALP